MRHFPAARLAPDGVGVFDAASDGLVHEQDLTKRFEAALSDEAFERDLTERFEELFLGDHDERFEGAPSDEAFEQDLTERFEGALNVKCFVSDSNEDSDDARCEGLSKDVEPLTGEMPEEPPDDVLAMYPTSKHDEVRALWRVAFGGE